MIKPLLDSRLAFVNVVDEIGERSSIFENSFLCAEIKGKDLPWDIDQAVW
jgi:hypothetical protein